MRPPITTSEVNTFFSGLHHRYCKLSKAREIAAVKITETGTESRRKSNDITGLYIHVAKYDVPIYDNRYDFFLCWLAIAYAVLNANVQNWQ